MTALFKTVPEFYKSIGVTLNGNVAYGKSEILLLNDDDLAAKAPWHQQGYTVAPFLEAADFEKLVAGLQVQFMAGISKAGISLPRDFEMEAYHLLPELQIDPELHVKIVRSITPVPFSEFPVETSKLENRISELLSVPVAIRANYHLRIVRPFSTDFNPLHRDVWLDRLKDGINLYVPVCGSNQLSSLYLVPGSHFWKESEVERTQGDYLMNGKPYQVSAITNVKQPLNLIRPNPGYNQVLLFSPYLVHGAAHNANPNQTRVSLEIRLFRS